MANLLTTTHAQKAVKKNWLFGQELEAAPTTARHGWNEGYLPTSKFLYFTEATNTASEGKTKVSAQ